MKIKKIYQKLYNIFRKARGKVQFKQLMSKNNLVPFNLSNEQKNQIKKLYSRYGIRVEYLYHNWYSSINGTFSPLYIPDWLFYNKIESYFNDNRLSLAYADKNMYDQIIATANMPITLVHNIGGLYFDEKYNVLNEKEVLNILGNEDEFVIKPSIDSGGGNNVKLITDFSNLQKILSNYNKNYIIQKRLIQHEEFSKYNSSSVNIVRLISL